MRIAMVTASALLGVSALATIALAGTTTTVPYPIPKKASGIKLNLVTAYNVCASPNATQFQAGIGLPACSPPVPTTTNNPLNDVEFGPKGLAQVGVSVSKGDIKIAIKASDIKNNGVAANGINLKATTASVIATSTNCHTGLPPQSPPANAYCTSTDLGPLFSAVFSVPCTAGKCALASTVNTIIPGTVMTGSQANTELSGIGLSDPDGDLTFHEGLFLP